ncbi:MAG TPA: DinB family protein [Parafilimonas sp.]|nr:DinB family protein [Parafilimonas sp.]
MKNEGFQTTTLIKELIFLLKKGNAHIGFNDAVKNIPFEDLGKKPGNLPYSIWQITEHIRIAQKDILDFSVNLNYKELDWPKDYWPENAAPESQADWESSVKAINDDLDEFIKVLENSENIYKAFDHGTGQTLLREAMLIADHNSYHTGEIIVLRRLLGNWK